MILRAWPAGRLCFPAGSLFPLAPRRSEGFLRGCRAPESVLSLAPAGQFTLRRQTRFKHPGPEPRCRRQTEGEAPCARERKERPGASQRGHCELRRSPRYRKRKAGHCPAFRLSKKWLAPLFRGVHSSLAPTARPGSYAGKPLLRKAFCGFAVHPPGGLLLSLRDNSPCAAKSD